MAGSGGTRTAAEWQARAGAAGRSDIAVIGAGQHGRVVASVLEAAGLPVGGHYDDDPETWGSELGNSSVIGAPDGIPSGSRAIIAIGDNETRKQVAQQLDLDWVTVIHPFSWLQPDVRLGPGTVVCSGVSVQVGADIGAHVILNNRASVGHDACVGDFAHLTVAHIGGESRAGEGAFLGIGSVILPRVRLGAWATVGAGSVVLADVRSGATVIGNPAREHTPRGVEAARPVSS